MSYLDGSTYAEAAPKRSGFLSETPSVLPDLWHYTAYTRIKETRNEVNLLNQVKCQQVAKNKLYFTLSLRNWRHTDVFESYLHFGNWNVKNVIQSDLWKNWNIHIPRNHLHQLYLLFFYTLKKKNQNYAFFIFGILILVNFTNLSSFNTNINDKGYIFNPNQRFSKACGEQHFSSVFFVAFLLVLIWFGN